MTNNEQLSMDDIDKNILSSTSSNKNDKQSKDNQTRNKEDQFKTVSFFNLFRFATRYDMFILIIGLLSALGHGAIAPLMLVYFANIIKTFYGQSTNLCKLNLTTLSTQYCEPGTLLTSDNYLMESRKCNLSGSWNITIPSETMFRQELYRQSMSLIVTGCLTLLFAFLQMSFCTLSCENQTRRIRNIVFNTLLKKDVSYFDKHSIGELTTISTSNINKIRDGIGDKLSMIVQLITKFLIGLIIAFIHSWKMTLVVLLTGPIICIVFIISSKISAKMFVQELKAYECAGAIAEEVFSSVRTVLSFNGAEHEQTRYDKHIEFARKQGIKKGAVHGILSGFMYLIIFCSYIIIVYYGNRLIQNENYNIANIILVFFSVISSIFSVGQSATYRESIEQAKVAAISVWNILYLENVEEKIDVNNVKISNNDYRGSIKFDNVFFSYPSRSDVSVLCGLNFEVLPGETVALVGASGCGKSTCIQLLQRFYEPTKGEILFDGQSIDSLHWKNLCQKIGVVNQEPILFSTTILKNIQYGQSNATFAEIQAAAIAANAHNFIMSLPEKYDTIVGEGGATLSGGERQRIVIARALVRNPTLLLLDEATSALDNQSEKIVQQALYNASKERTTIIVTHRLSTVRHAQKIIVIDNGLVIEEGTHETLMNRKSTYYSLVQAQMFDQLIEEDNEQIPELIPYIDDNDDSISDDEKTIFQREKETINVNSNNKIRWPTLEILKLNRPELLLIIIGGLASIFHGGLELVPSILLSRIIMIYQECNIEIQNKMVQFYIIMIILLAIVVCIVIFIQNFMFACSGEALTKRLRSKAFRIILQQEIDWFDNPENNTGALCTRLSTEPTTIQTLAGIRIASILSSFANLILGIILSFIFGWKLSLIAVIFIPFMVAGGFLQGYLVTLFSDEENQSLEYAGSLAVQALRNIRTVKQLGIENQLIDDYNHLLNLPYRSSFKRVYILSFIYSLTTSIVSFSMAVVFYYGGILVEQNQMTFQNVMIVENCMLFGIQAVGNGAALASDYGKALSAAKRMLLLFTRISKVPAVSHGLKLENFTGDVHFKGLYFAYATRADVPILNNFTLDIKTGQRIALIGTSGNGKSTVLHLLERFYDVQNGLVCIGSKDLRDLNLNWWRSQIGIVTQEPTLFNISIAENIAYGDLSRHVTIEEMIEAAKIANIHDFIQNLPQGYETCVGSKGDRLSGGQKQRIAICRVLIRNPKVILLDEATSALDCENEKIVNEALSRVMMGRTSIVVTHRLSAIHDFDLICVLQHGYIVECGTHQQLLTKKGYYYKLSQSINKS